MTLSSIAKRRELEEGVFPDETRTVLATTAYDLSPKMNVFKHQDCDSKETRVMSSMMD